MKSSIIVINAGSSSLKFKLFEQKSLQDFSNGQITGIGTDIVKIKVKDSINSNILKDEELSNTLSREEIFTYLIDTLNNIYSDIKIIAAGHRVVHGGSIYTKPIQIDNDVIKNLKTIQYLSPLHLPHNIQPMEVLASKLPDIKQIACFDTSFHSTNPKYTRAYAIPKDLAENDQIIRYGFHGISYQYIAEKLKENYFELYNGKVVVCHLGAGASLCALVSGKSYTTTMGFTPLDGLVMGSRPGNIDAGIILYLMQHKGYSAKDIEEMLYYKSGVLGLTGWTSDFYQLQKSDDLIAKEALKVYSYNLVKHIGSMIAVMGGVDSIIFTAGVGENDDEIREYVSDAFKYLGTKLDTDANKTNKEVITTSDSKIKMLVIPTNEELMIAQEVVNNL